MGETSGAETDNLSGALEIIAIIIGVRISQTIVFCVVFRGPCLSFHLFSFWQWHASSFQQ
jgi:hypothetical protein